MTFHLSAALSTSTFRFTNGINSSNRSRSSTLTTAVTVMSQTQRCFQVPTHGARFRGSQRGAHGAW